MLPSASLTILVVDDDADTRELYTEAFAATGSTVRTAASLAEALVVLGEIEPDVLIADYSLPDGTGSALLERCTGARPRLCVLATGFQENQVAASGFDLVLTKPVDFRLLVEAVQIRGRTPGRN